MREGERERGSERGIDGMREREIGREGMRERERKGVREGEREQGRAGEQSGVCACARACVHVGAYWCMCVHVCAPSLLVYLGQKVTSRSTNRTLSTLCIICN